MEGKTEMIEGDDNEALRMMEAVSDHIMLLEWAREVLPSTAWIEKDGELVSALCDTDALLALIQRTRDYYDRASREG